MAPSRLLVVATGCLLLLGMSGATTAGTTTQYSGKASDCASLFGVGKDVQLPDCEVRHQGTFTRTGCDGDICTFAVTGAVEAKGLTPTQKGIMHQIWVGSGPVYTTVTLCEKSGTGSSLSCSGSATLKLAMKPNTCISLDAVTFYDDRASLPQGVPSPFSKSLWTATTVCTW